MNNNLEGKILKEIKENLPEAVGEELRKYLQEFEELKIKHKSLQDKCVELKGEKEEFIKINSRNNRKLLEYEEKLKNYEQEKESFDLDKRELSLRKLEADLLIKHSNEIKHLVIDLYKIPFANRKFRETILQDKPLKQNRTYYEWDNNKCENVPINCVDEVKEEFKKVTEREEH